MDKNKTYEELKELNKGNIHISYSELSLYNQCGHKHLLEKYLKIIAPTTSIHLIFGNSIHSTLEMGLKENYDLEKRIAYFKEMFLREMMNSLKDTPEYAQTQQFANQGENILRLMSTEKILEKYDLVGVEEVLYEKLFHNFHFKGFIDLVLKEKNGDKYIIIDWKTSGEAWDVSKKKKDEIFMAQMRFYKYFYARKFNVPFDKIECKYVVLNRLKSKKCPELGYGTIQSVEIYSTPEDIKNSLELVARTMRNIHIEKYFSKAKLNNMKGSCFFCPHKNDPTLCNEDPNQYLTLLKENEDKLLQS